MNTRILLLVGLALTSLAQAQNTKDIIPGRNLNAPTERELKHYERQKGWQQREQAATDAANAQIEADRIKATPARGTTDYDTSAVAADRAGKAARLEQNKKALAQQDSGCVIKQAMSDAEINRCRQL